MMGGSGRRWRVEGWSVKGTRHWQAGGGWFWFGSARGRQRREWERPGTKGGSEEAAVAC